MTEQELQDQIEQLQMKVSFQEDTIEQLNHALTAQQKNLDQLNFQVKHVIGKVKQMQVSNIASESEETPPPHY